MRQRLRAFAGARGGNVAITFALAALPMLGFVGAAVDYSHANSVKAAMQAAADSTALMLSKSVTGLSDSQVTTKANDYFKALFTRPEATDLVINASYSKSNSSQVTVNASSSVKTEFMRIMGFQSLKVAVDSQVKWGGKKLHVALALDNTGSMASAGKMLALKTASLNLLDMLKDAATNPSDVRVAIVPFSKNVNIGKINIAKSFIDWEDWDDDNGHDVSKTVCVNQKTGKHGKKVKKCTTSTTWVPDDHDTWNGCVTDRDQDYDILNTKPNSSIPGTLFPAEQYDACPAPLVGLTQTNKFADLIALVGSMFPAGNTNQQIGLAWAWHALTNAEPLNAPQKGADTDQIIILMSDGLNTENRWSNSAAEIDARQAKLCENIKKAGITIYSVQVNTGGDPVQTVMKNCASGPDKFFLLTTANQMISTFNEIGTKITKLRIAN
jgi:Flp pilus assembly protein TadG